jgi:serine/threonine-protein kinase HipA
MIEGQCSCVLNTIEGHLCTHRYTVDRNGKPLRSGFENFGINSPATSSKATCRAKLLDAAIFNYLIGNNDAHGKNFSLVYPNKEIRLAPLYDAISAINYPELNTDMAMRIGREYSSEKVTPKDYLTWAMAE